MIVRQRVPVDSSWTSTFFDGLGSAVVGGVAAALVALLVVKLTRTDTKKQAARAQVLSLMEGGKVLLEDLRQILDGGVEAQGKRMDVWLRWLYKADLAQSVIKAADPALANKVGVLTKGLGLKIDHLNENPKMPTLDAQATYEAWKKEYDPWNEAFQGRHKEVTDLIFALQSSLGAWYADSF